MIRVANRSGKLWVFKRINLSFVIIAPDPRSLEDVSKEILSEFLDMDCVLDAARCIQVPCADVFSDADDLFRFLAFVSSSRRDRAGTLLTADMAAVDRYRAQHLMKAEIANALDEDRVEVFYQPIYSTAEHRFASAEALIRIRTRDGELLSPGLINLEITETASISARITLLETMKRLIDYGFTFSLDDFGKGESNLMYVVEMPVSIVKLDYDLTKAFFRSPKARQVVQAVVGMAHNMGLKLVAEGIETDEEFAGMN